MLNRLSKTRYFGRLIVLQHLIKNDLNLNLFFLIKEILHFLFRGYSKKLKYWYKYYYLIRYVNNEEKEWMANEIFEQRVYKLNYPFQKPIIVDIGANIGLATLFLKQQFPQAKIVAYEPNPIPYQALKENIVTNHLSNVSCKEEAVRGKKHQARKTYFYYSEEHSLSSTLHKEHIASRFPYKKRLVRTVLLSDVIKELKKIDILKIDAEGEEYFLQSEIIKYRDYINSFIIEVHRIPGKNMYSLVYNLSKYYEIRIYAKKKEKNCFIIYGTNKSLILSRNL